MINILSGVDSTVAALTAEKVRIDVVSQNIANSHVIRGIDGKPYQRQQVVFESLLTQAQGPKRSSFGDLQSLPVAHVSIDGRAPRLIRSPDHPEADANGMISVPNINMHEEMVDLISASRAYDANLTALKTARSMAMQTLALGKR